MPSPFFISQKDDQLLGVANSSDGLGLLPIWSARARGLVPHLTEQTIDIRAFQILVEAFRLWSVFESRHTQYAGRLDDFFLLVEQTFARTIGQRHGDWPLPGARRIRARLKDPPHISIADPDWHLLGAQKANGLWGLYRGAARRAGLLTEDSMNLSAATAAAARQTPGLRRSAQTSFFELAKRAMAGATVALPTHLNSHLVRDLSSTFQDVPLAGHLYKKLISDHPLNFALAKRLASSAKLDHRAFLQAASRDLTEHRQTIQGVIRCEDLLSVVEAVFFWLCAHKGQTIDAAVAELPVDLQTLESARVHFQPPELHQGGAAIHRQRRLARLLDTTSKAALARSVLSIHSEVSDERRRALWVWEEQGLLQSDVEEVEKPEETALQVGLAWRNSYYLPSLRSIASQFGELFHG